MRSAGDAPLTAFQIELCPLGAVELSGSHEGQDQQAHGEHGLPSTVVVIELPQEGREPGAVERLTVLYLPGLDCPAEVLCRVAHRDALGDRKAEYSIAPLDKAGRHIQGVAPFDLANDGE